VRRASFDVEGADNPPPSVVHGSGPPPGAGGEDAPFFDGPEMGGEGSGPGDCTGCSAGRGTCGGCGGNACCNSCRNCLDDSPPCCSSLQNQLELRGEYLLWWAKGDPVPPLVTTSTTGTAQTAAGVLGQPNTSILFGDSNLNDQVRSGGRFTADYWFDCGHCVGIEADYLFLGDHQQGFDASSDGSVILARPFYNTQTAAQDSELVAYPNVQSGSIHVSSTSAFDGAEVLLRSNWFAQCGSTVDLLLGYRYLRLADNLGIAESVISTDETGILPVQTNVQVSDNFRTLNQFNGANLGMLGQWHCCGWSLDLLMKLGLGSTNSRVSVNGATTVTEPTGASTNYSGGILAPATSIGTYDHSGFSMVPELGATVGYDLSCRLRLTCGYTLLYWSSVARAGDQINTALNPAEFPPSQLAGAQAPPFKIAYTDFWAQGVNLGLDFRF